MRGRPPGQPSAPVFLTPKCERNARHKKVLRCEARTGWRHRSRVRYAATAFSTHAVDALGAARTVYALVTAYAVFVRMARQAIETA